MRKVYIAMPTMDKPEVQTQFCLLETLRGLETKRIPYKMRYTFRGAILPKVRNFFVADFLASDCTDLVMLDDDLWWEDGALLRLLSHDCDLVGGVYPKRQDPIEYPVRRVDGAEVDANGLLEVKYLPTGFLRMTRTCLERMVQAYGHLSYDDNDCPNKTAHALFWYDIAPDPDEDRERAFWGEDFTFCRRWREIGGTVKLDTLLTFGHIGKKAFMGCYGDDLAAVEAQQVTQSAA